MYSRKWGALTTSPSGVIRLFLFFCKFEKPYLLSSLYETSGWSLGELTESRLLEMKNDQKLGTWDRGQAGYNSAAQ